jgi:hypothetical protein
MPAAVNKAAQAAAALPVAKGAAWGDAAASCAQDAPEGTGLQLAASGKDATGLESGGGGGGAPAS